MNFIYGLLVGIAVSTIVCLIWLKTRRQEEKPIQAAGVVNPNPDVEIRKENLAKLEEIIAAKDKITNDEVQAALGVSDATAERYLEELEKQGKLKQVGGTEKGTYYIKI